MTSRVDFAREFATRAHKAMGQTYGVHPYVYHLYRVADIVSNHHSDKDELCLEVAYLHDILEDTNISVGCLGTIFGAITAICVAEITDPPGETRAIRKALLNERLAQCHHTPALIVKTADRLANLQACAVNNNHTMFKRYAEEHGEFKKACYREGVCETMWMQIDSLVRLVQ